MGLKVYKRVNPACVWQPGRDGPQNMAHPGPRSITSEENLEAKHMHVPIISLSHNKRQTSSFRFCFTLNIWNTTNAALTKKNQCQQMASNFVVCI